MKLNDTFNVQVNASGMKDMHNAVFVLTYDPKLLDVVSQVEGNLLKETGKPSTFQSFVDKKKGEVWVSGTRSSESLMGSGVLAQFTFKATAKGTAGIAFTNVNITQKSGAQLPVTAFKSVVEVK